MLRDAPIILWHLSDGPPADDTHHTAAGIVAAAELLGCRPFEIYRAIIGGEAVSGGSWYADLADPRQLEASCR